MKDRMKMFLYFKNYAKTARYFNVDPATIRKQMQNIQDERVQAVVRLRTHKQYKSCFVCNRSFDKVKYLCKGQCATCYVYLRRSASFRKDRKVVLAYEN